ncbi:hypothetical protein [Thioalkalivibrio sp. ALJT]|uniref:hypothetical protein n=1 Tax=Thioalkalivibrio sp. ALJT TaxID=1158146 RepID=UPI000376A4D9|nr:hypothetical protein [Thioalkalivibrio sp. ALJT]
MIHTKSKFRAHAATALLFSALAVAPAHASVIEAESEAFVISSSISVLGNNLLDVGPTPLASGTAPGTYDETAQTAGLNVDASPLANLSTGILNATASSDVDGGSGIRTTSASAEVAGLGLSLVDLPLLDPLIGLSASALGSEATVSGEHGSLVATGSSHLADLGLQIAGTNVDLDVSASGEVDLALPAGLAGISLFLDEQTVTGDGVEEKGIDVNVLRLSLEAVNIASLLDFAGIGTGGLVGGLLEGLGLTGGSVLAGDLTISSSSAFMRADAPTAVSAPATVLLLTVGLLALVALRRSGRLQVRSRPSAQGLAA